MTNIADDEATEAIIVASCKQTRFHISDTNKSTEIDIVGLSLGIAPSGAARKAKKGKGKAASAQEKELLVNAELRLKSGIHYALLGRNGSGKSTILRALADRIIPGLPPSLRVAILQQTSTDAENPRPAKDGPRTSVPEDTTVLQHVIEGDQSRTALIQDLQALAGTDADREDVITQVRRYRQMRYNRLNRDLLEVQNNAYRRSGARGSQARKDLIAFEKEVAEATEKLAEEITDSPAIQDEFLTASSLLVDLEAELETMPLPALETRARSILTALGFTEATLAKPIPTLSGGWRMRAALARALLQKADLLILDEPTNFLDLRAIIWLQSHLIALRDSQAGTTVLLVSHDREFVDSVAEEVILVKEQSLEYFRGNLSAYEEDFRSRVLNLTRMLEAQGKETARLEKSIRETIKVGKKTGDDNKLRMAKSRQKRLEDGAGMQVNEKGQRFKLSDRMGWFDSKHAAIEIPKDEQGVSISLLPAPDLRFPGPLLSLEDVSYRYAPTSPLVLQNMTLSIHLGDRIGIVGLNGGGKTTLLNLLTESLRPNRGAVTRHPRLKLGYYSQHAVEDLQVLGRKEEGLTALKLLAEDSAGEMAEQEMRGLLGSFGLQRRTASDVPLAKLSGGQLVCLALVRILWSRPNLLILDEVTTHLDYRTVIALGEALIDYSGAVVLVTHDRYLVRRVVEGEVFTNGGEDEGGRGEEEEDNRRRVVYSLSGGKMKVLEKGMEGFVRVMEKRVAKMGI
ncbi:hypothetical protein VC83_07757 [Pseudogymnoascus destructans]|uniref:ABC transporter domain-containing protein n=1 Tax=Pseudogymnoascus destructans TaxID=655981 RepID=A0A177A2R5_9PEZI|nr:uncharacterized protein VC83_07757 [Pseudogymnoascus destructans]OAF55762.2 hypothetical protein VC83_07757 [Pseudogymnoascus destructans]